MMPIYRGTWTPWGPAQDVQNLAPGVVADVLRATGYWTGEDEDALADLRAFCKQLEVKP